MLDRQDPGFVDFLLRGDCHSAVKKQRTLQLVSDYQLHCHAVGGFLLCEFELYIRLCGVWLVANSGWLILGNDDIYPERLSSEKVHLIVQHVRDSAEFLLIIMLVVDVQFQKKWLPKNWDLLRCAVQRNQAG